MQIKLSKGFSSKMVVLVMILEKYGSNENMLKVSENVWIVYHSNCKHLHHRLILTIHQFFEPER